MEKKIAYAWIVDKWNYTHFQFIQWINKEYWRHDGSWEIRKLA